MWDLIVSVPDHCLSFYFSNLGCCISKESIFRLLIRCFSSVHMILFFCIQIQCLLILYTTQNYDWLERLITQ